MNIIQKPVPGFQSRGNQIPLIIVDHISVGSMGSMYNHFSNRNNKASSHFGIGRDGSIVQYVDLRQAAWTQGKVQLPSAPIIKKMMGNPNLYGVSIEHEGYAGNGLDGDLTEAQFWATCWLHKYIQEEVEKIYNHKIDLNSHHVIGHFQIDSKGKPFCPGPKFPWASLYAELVYANTMTLSQYTERVAYKQSSSSHKVMAFAFAARVVDLESKLTHKVYAAEARRKLLLLTPVLDSLSFSSYYNEVTPENIAARVKQIHNNSLTVRWEELGIEKLLVGFNYAREIGLL